MTEPQTAGAHRGGRSRFREHLVTVVCAVLLVAGGVYVILRPGDTQAQDPAPSGAPSGAAAEQSSKPAPAGHVSGLAMPKGDLPGWKQVLADDFTGDVETNWGKYNGMPDGDPGGWFDPSHVNANQGELVITGTRKQTPNGRIYATGGMAAKVSQVYGRYEVRFRMDKGRGIQFNLLLWPSDDSWPPEINFAEDNGKERTGFATTLHYGPPHKTVSRYLKIDTSKWHTAGLEWSPGKLSYLMDGKVWATVQTSAVPKVPMQLAIQTQAWHCGTQWAGCPNSNTPAQVNLHVDWVVIYSRATP